MTKQEQIALLNKTSVTKIELINEINAHLNAHPNYMPFHGTNKQLTRKMKDFCVKNGLTPLNLHFFAKSLPTSLKSNNSNWWSSGNPQNDIIVVADQNKKKHLCVVRGGGLPTLLDIDTKITTPTIKNIFMTFVLNGVDSSNLIRQIKKIQLQTCELNEQIKCKLFINNETNDSLNLIRFSDFKFDTSNLSFRYDFRYVFFNKNSGKLSNSSLSQRQTTYQLPQIEKKIDELVGIAKREVNKENLLFYVNQNYEKRLKNLKEDTETAIQTISSFFK